MSWQVVVDGVVDPREFKDHREFSAAIKLGVEQGKIPPSAAIHVQRTPRPEPADQVAEETVQAIVDGARVPVFVYERRLAHNSVMGGAVAIGILLGTPLGILVSKVFL